MTTSALGTFGVFGHYSQWQQLTSGQLQEIEALGYGAIWAGGSPAADRSAGAHPYLTTPEHTATAREVIGDDAFLAPEHKVVLTTDAERARAVGRKALDIYFQLANYRNNWKRLGFGDEEVTKPGSDRLVDAVVAHGTVEDIAARLKQHLDAGADHVPVQALTGPDKLVPALAELAGPLGLT